MGSQVRRGAQRGSLVFSLRMLATARMWRSEDKLRELGQAGTRLLPHGSPRSNTVSRFGSKHLLILGTILSALQGLFFFFNTNNDIIGRRQKFRYNFQRPL